jgi:hypothetical protein
VRQRDLAVEAGLAQQLGGAPLVGRVGPGVQEGHGDRVHPCGPQLPSGLQDGGLVERHVHRAVGPHPLPHREPPATRHQGRRRGPAQVEGVLAGAPPDLEHVAEALGAEQPDDRAAALQQRVQAHRGAVGEPPQARQAVAGDPGDGVQHAARRGLGVRQPLADRDRAAVVGDDVRERPADVDADRQDFDHCRNSGRSE